MTLTSYVKITLLILVFTAQLSTLTAAQPDTKMLKLALALMSEIDLGSSELENPSDSLIQHYSRVSSKLEVLAEDLSGDYKQIVLLQAAQSSALINTQLALEEALALLPDSDELLDILYYRYHLTKEIYRKKHGLSTFKKVPHIEALKDKIAPRIPLSNFTTDYDDNKYFEAQKRSKELIVFTTAHPTLHYTVLSSIAYCYSKMGLYEDASKTLREDLFSGLNTSRYKVPGLNPLLHSYPYELFEEMAIAEKMSGDIEGAFIALTYFAMVGRHGYSREKVLKRVFTILDTPSAQNQEGELTVEGIQRVVKYYRNIYMGIRAKEVLQKYPVLPKSDSLATYLEKQWANRIPRILKHWPTEDSCYFMGRIIDSSYVDSVPRFIDR